MKLCFLDVETTGVDPVKNGIVQIGAQIDLNGKVIDEFDIKVRPFEKDEIEDSALEKNGFTREQIAKFPEPAKMHAFLLSKFDRYVGRYKNKDKFHFIGYNVMPFDYPFMRAWFKKLEDDFFGSWFWWPPIDVAVLSGAKIMEQRSGYKNWKLSTACRAHGIIVDDDKTHDALYDVSLARELYYRVTAKEVVNHDG